MMNTQLEKLDQIDQTDELHQPQLSEDSTDSDDSIQRDESKSKQNVFISKFVIHLFSYIYV